MTTTNPPLAPGHTRYTWWMSLTWGQAGGQRYGQMRAQFDTDQPVSRFAVLNEALETAYANKVPKYAVVMAFDVQPDIVGGAS